MKKILSVLLLLPLIAPSVFGGTISVVTARANHAEPSSRLSDDHTFPPFALRTNLLHDAFLIPSLGVEWRVNPSVGIKLDGGLSYWGDETGKVQKLWLLNPEVRWYLGASRRLYAGVGGTYSHYNSYGYLLGKLWPQTTGYGGYTGATGYQGSLWNAGLTVGYQLPLSDCLSIDFNLGLGYTSLKYDSFNMIDRVRVYQSKGETKSFWGPTQAGITLMWKL